MLRKKRLKLQITNLVLVYWPWK